MHLAEEKFHPHPTYSLGYCVINPSPPELVVGGVGWLLWEGAVAAIGSSSR